MKIQSDIQLIRGSGNGSPDFLKKDKLGIDKSVETIYNTQASQRAKRVEKLLRKKSKKVLDKMNLMRYNSKAVCESNGEKEKLYLVN